MLASFITIALRSVVRNLNYSLITTSSLVVGITTSLVIFTWATFELSYDRQDPDANRVFVVMSNEQLDGVVETQSETYAPLMDALVNEIPEVDAVTRIDNTGEQLTYAGKSVGREGAYGDPDFFSVFQTTQLEGTLDALADKTSIAISDELAALLFNNLPAVGKVITLGKRGDYKVAAVYKSYPKNNSLHYVHFVLPYDALPRDPEEWVGYYVKLNQAESRTSVEKKIDANFKEFFGHDRITSMLFCLTDWRLHWNFENGKVSGGRIVYVVIFCLLGFFILMMGCVNYMNIATARAARRAKEIGVRKMTGAGRGTLIRQFLGESTMLSIVAAALSLLLSYLLLPMAREFTGSPLVLSMTDPMLWIGLIAITGFAGLFAGSYPAFLLSALKPATVMKTHDHAVFTGAALRKSLIVFQFVLSIVMIFGAMVVWQQTDYLLRRDVGYDKHNVINVWLPGDGTLPLEAFRNDVLGSPAVVSAAYGGASPMEVNGYAQVKWAGMPTDREVYFYGASAGFDMISALGLKLLQGRDFSRDRISDSANFVITKMAAEALGFENPVGQQITYTMFGERTGEIIGVIDDFTHNDIHLPMEPVVFCVGRTTELYNLFVRYRDHQAKDALEHVKKQFARFQPGVTLSYSFLDEDFENQLYNEVFLGRLSLVLTGVAIAIASLGLLGLTLFNAERRTKEIGIRKVLGASVAQVIFLLNREFITPLLISFAIAFPAGFYLMSAYLEGFPFRVSFDVFSFAWVALAMIALVTCAASLLSYRAATSHPAKTLKAE